MTLNLRYVNNIHNFILLPSVVLSFIHILISFLKIEQMRERLLSEQRLRAIQEEIAGFLLKEVVLPKGEFYSRGA